jgi:rubrerythrin
MFGARSSNDEELKISNIFFTVGRNNRFIAERLRRILYGGDTSTLENLLETSEDAEYAEKNIYREYSQIAAEEGFNDIASLFNGIGNIKINQTLVLQGTARDIENNELYCKREVRLWICLGCGNIMSGLCAPVVCPICGYPQSYYELFISLDF